MEWEDIQFLAFPTKLHQTQGAQGHMTHKDSTEHAQSTKLLHFLFFYYKYPTQITSFYRVTRLC